MQAADRLNGIGEYYFSQKLREIDGLKKQGKDIINLGIGSPDMAPHASVIETLREAAARPDVHAYQGYKGIPALRLAIAKWYERWYAVSLDPETEILPLIGSKEGIMHICMAFLNEGDGVLVPNPGYPTYRSAVKLSGGIAIDYLLEENNEWGPDFTRLTEQVTQFEAAGKKVKMMFVNYPHMPTGQLPQKELFEKLVEFGKQQGIIICHDNPYSFILNDDPRSLLSVKGAREVAIELNSLSKSHNMAGWRVGMLLGSKENVDTVLRFKSNMDSGMFLPVQLAAAKALELDNDWHEQLNAVYTERRLKVFSLLDLLECRYSSSQAGMFVWAAIPGNYRDCYELSDEVLYKADVFITPGGIFGTAGEQYIRVSLCSSIERIEESIQRIKKNKPVANGSLA